MVRESVLKFWLQADYLKSKQLTVSCKSRCVIEEGMARYLRAEWLCAPGGLQCLGRCCVRTEGERKTIKCPLNNVNKPQRCAEKALVKKKKKVL